jgi:hypothetical protein
MNVIGQNGNDWLYDTKTKNNNLKNLYYEQFSKPLNSYKKMAARVHRSKKLLKQIVLMLQKEFALNMTKNNHNQSNNV